MCLQADRHAVCATFNGKLVNASNVLFKNAIKSNMYGDAIPGDSTNIQS